jgi:hypothetical protein
MLKVVFFLFLLALIACSSEKEKIINGQILDYNNKPLYLDFLGSDQILPVDSSFCDNEGYFSFDFKAIELGIYRIRLESGEAVQLLLNEDSHPEIFTLYDSLALSLSNSDLISDGITELNKIIARQRLAESKIKTDYEEAKNNHQEHEVFQQLNSKYTLLNIHYNLSLKNFILTHLEDLSSIVALGNFNFINDIELFQKSIPTLKESFPNSPYISYFEEKFKEETYLIGEPLPAINLDQFPIQLTEIQDSFILVEFWSSWNREYIQQIHFQKELYNRYQDKGFEIYSINFDIDETSWLTTINKLNFQWKNVNDSLGFENSSLTDLLQIKKLPSNLLINKNRIVVAKNIYGEKLQDKLIQLYSF